MRNVMVTGEAVGRCLACALAIPATAAALGACGPSSQDITGRAVQADSEDGGGSSSSGSSGGGPCTSGSSGGGSSGGTDYIGYDCNFTPPDDATTQIANLNSDTFQTRQTAYNTLRDELRQAIYNCTVSSDGYYTLLAAAQSYLASISPATLEQSRRLQLLSGALYDPNASAFNSLCAEYTACIPVDGVVDPATGTTSFTSTQAYWNGRCMGCMGTSSDAMSFSACYSAPPPFGD